MKTKLNQWEINKDNGKQQINIKQTKQQKTNGNNRRQAKPIEN